MNVILTHCSFENFDVLRIADLDNQFSAPLLNLPFKDVVTIFRDPDNMNGQAANRVAPFALFGHDVFRQSYHLSAALNSSQKCVAAKASH
jgi:hypothetical protein